MQAMDPKPENLKPVSAERQPKSVRLVDEIVRYGDLAYNPALPEADRAANVIRFRNLLSGMKVLALSPALTALLQSGRVQEWLRPHISHALALLPLRTQGVHHTIEFILSVYSSAAQQASSAQTQVPESRGASISLEALNSASRLIALPPSDMSADSWYSAVAPQLLSLLDGQGGLEMIKASAYIIGYGILGRKAFGAPGTPGWKNFADRIISQIDPTLGSKTQENGEELGPATSEVPLIRARNILVTAPKLAEGLRRLASLLSSHPNPGLSKRLLEPLLLPLWSLSSWTEDKSDALEDQWLAPAQFLLQILLQLSSGGTLLTKVTRNILFQGNRDQSKILWTYETAPSGGIQIRRWADHHEKSLAFDKRIINVLDKKVDVFINLVKPVKDHDDVPALFLSLCKKWLLAKNEGYQSNIVISGGDLEDQNDVESKLIEGKIMGRLIESFPDRLVSNSTQILELATEVLNEAIRGKEDLDSNENLAIALSLTNMVFSTGKPLADKSLKDSIKTALKGLADKTGSESSTTARNLLHLLDFQVAEAAMQASPSVSPDRNLEDRRTYSLAYSYLTGADSPPPVRAQGLDLISGLILASSPILDIPATIILLSSFLQDEEEYIYLRVIKTLIQLSFKHSKAVMLNLLERYVDASEDNSLDSRLRVGEALLQVLQKAGQLFTGDLARQVGEGLLTVAGRRGYRPKREAEQRKKAALTKRQNKEAEDAWDGPVPQLEDLPKEEVDDPILAQIVEGWEGKQGEEDVRIRASALSIFGSTIETNIAGSDSATISGAVDLSIHILTLEPEHAKAILRRAAALLVMSLVRALDAARERGTKLGFGLAGSSLDDVLRILRYVAETDNDGLVRSHAKDVMEGLETWQIKGLVPPRGGGGGSSMVEVGDLAGLSIGSERRPGAASTQRPRIEEIE